MGCHVQRCLSMKLHKILLEGYRGILSGMCKDALELDFDALLPHEAQLVAVVGPNGSGKTTLIDNLHPYRVMPSRVAPGGAPTPGAFSFYDQLARAEGRKVLEWSLGPRRFVSTLLFKQNGRKKMDAYLHEKAPNGLVPVTLPDGTVSDGKTDTYDRCVEALLGPPELFFTSHFCAQTRRKLSAMANADVKRVLSAMLNLESVLERGKAASQVARLLRQAVERQRPLISHGESARKALADLARSEQALVSQIEQAEGERPGKKAAHVAAVEALTKAQLAADAAKAVEAKRAELAARIAAEERRIADLVARLAAENSADLDQAQRVHAALTADAARARQAINAARQAQARAKPIVAQKAEIQAAQARFPELETALAAAQAALERGRSTVEAVRELRGRLNVGRTEAAAQQRDLQALENQCGELRKVASLTAEVPCLGSDLQPRCKLLKDANDAQARIPILDQRVLEARALQLERAKAVETLSSEVVKSELPERYLEGLQATVAAGQSALDAARRMAANDSLVSEAERALSAAQADEAQGMQTLADLEARKEAAAAEFARLQARISQRRVEEETRAREGATALRQELEGLAPPQPDGMSQAQLALARAEREEKEVETRIDSAKRQAAAVQSRRAVAESEMARGDEAATKAKAIEAEISRWTLLAKALSPDGVVALEIDDAGPALSALANDLLLACYGPRFTVSIATQEETAKGDLREGFDIVVYDGERDESKSVNDMSGGEQVWINECIVRAISLYQSQGNPQAVRTLSSDEADGPLDAERKRMFMAMKREVLRIGGYEREFFVSQTPELWELADAVIDVGAMGARLPAATALAA